jgi:hypothetical protein
MRTFISPYLKNFYTLRNLWFDCSKNFSLSSYRLSVDKLKFVGPSS